MVAEGLARHHSPASTIDEVWHRVEAAWIDEVWHRVEPVTDIQTLFDPMPRRMKAVIAAMGGYSGY